MDDNNIYVTLLATDDYLGGVLGLQYSLRINHCKYPLLVLVTSNCSQEIYLELKKNNIFYKRIPNILFPKEAPNFKKNPYSCTLNKFYVFNLVQYDKVFFLDADCIVSTNIDFLFYKNECYWKNKFNLISGTCFLIKPNKNIFIKAIQHKNNCFNDEQLLSDFFSVEDKELIDDKIPYIIKHIGKKPKYWMNISKDKIKTIVLRAQLPQIKGYPLDILKI